jgi:hypothetical protein
VLCKHDLIYAEIKITICQTLAPNGVEGVAVYSVLYEKNYLSCKKNLLLLKEDGTYA